MENFYKVTRVINNNVVMGYDIRDERCLIIGKGLGFAAKSQSRIYDTSKIEKVYYLMEPETLYRFDSLSKQVNEKVIGAVEEAIVKVEELIGKPLKESIHITLLDHINFSISRIKNGMEIKNLFIHEIKFLYTEEYIAAEKVLEYINSRLDTALPMEEAGFIALHIHAATNNGNLKEVMASKDILEFMLSSIEGFLKKELNKESIYYFRLITHLRFAIDRVMKNIVLDNPLLDAIKERYQDSYFFSVNLAGEISSEHGVNFSDDEIGYITMHIENMRRERRRI